MVINKDVERLLFQGQIQKVGVWGCFASCVWCGEWTVHCSLSSWTVDSQLSMQAFFFVFFSWFRVRGLKARSSQVSDMFPNEFAIALCVFRVTLCVSALDYS